MCSVCFAIQHWDVFEPYRDMKRRRQKRRSDADAVDTHREVFPEYSAPTMRKPVNNPVRFTKNTPKIIEVVIFVCKMMITVTKSYI